MPYAPGRNGTCEKKKKIKKHEVKIQSLLMSYFMVILREVFFFLPGLNVTAVITERTVKSKLACRAKEQIIRTCKSHINW